MRIHLPEELQLYVQTTVQSGRFASEEEAVTEAVRMLRQSEEVKRQSAVAGPEPAWRKVVELMKEVPDAVFDRIPADSSEQLDHYIYGSPRRLNP